MKTTITHIFVSIIACATIGAHVPLISLFLIAVSIVTLASQLKQNTNQNRIF